MRHLTEGELLDLELVVDLGQELRALARQLAVLLVARRVPCLDEPDRVPVGERNATQRGQLPADVGDHIAKRVDDSREVVEVGDGDDGLLQVQRARASQLAPHRHSRAGVVRGQPVEQQDPSEHGLGR